MSFSATAAEVIGLATRIRDYWETELPKRHAGKSVIPLSEITSPSPPETAQLRELLSNLPTDDVYKLLLMMYLGSGQVDVNNLEFHYHELKRQFQKPEWAISQLVGKTKLADYLLDGLLMLKKAKGITPDDFTFASVEQ